MKKCNGCHEEKSFSEFYVKYKERPESPSRYSGQCQECLRAIEKQRTIKRREGNTKRKTSRPTNESVLRSYHRMRMKVLMHYSNGDPKCACCGEREYMFLAIDHINGGGTQHLKAINRYSLARWLLKNNFPEGFRILCHNCNHAYGHYGTCPHQNKANESYP